MLGSRSLALSLALSLAVAACGRASGPTIPQTGLPTGTLTIRGASSEVTLSVEIAETETSRRIGLMGRTTLAPDAGMAFLDPHESGFWMENTPIPLSIAFWDAQDRIVDIHDLQPCEADPCPLYSPQMPYEGAVEANTGWFEDHGVGTGDTVVLQR